MNKFTILLLALTGQSIRSSRSPSPTRARPALVEVQRWQLLPLLEQAERYGSRTLRWVTLSGTFLLLFRRSCPICGRLPLGAAFGTQFPDLLLIAHVLEIFVNHF